MGAGAEPELWFLLMHQTMNVSYNVSAVEGLFQRAEAAGYRGAILYDHNLEALASPRLTPAYLPSLRGVLDSARRHHLEVMPQIASYGHSDGMIFQDARMVEAKPATALYTVAQSGRELLPRKPSGKPPSLVNGGFAQHRGDRLKGWTVQDAPGGRTFWDGTGGRQGGASVRMQAGAPDDSAGTR